ncbi:hypothetical protein V565_167010 [Rhizoctonia solani 123E]|uniref:Uncharacterized protein n=1 Tax=Rhizoctonia solani 123E TaxID=1423351 RepID=A0A074SAS6_9AGAM|nr:hypothetical protein V565_167010 [Rhizoctonia solani 123E]
MSIRRMEMRIWVRPYIPVRRVLVPSRGLVRQGVQGRAKRVWFREMRSDCEVHRVRWCKNISQKSENPNPNLNLNRSNPRPLQPKPNPPGPNPKSTSSPTSRSQVQAPAPAHAHSKTRLVWPDSKPHARPKGTLSLPACRLQTTDPTRPNSPSQDPSSRSFQADFLPRGCPDPGRRWQRRHPD